MTLSADTVNVTPTFVGRNICAMRAAPASVSRAIIRNLAVVIVRPPFAGRIPEGSKQRSQEQCKARTKAGRPCRAPAVEAGLCFCHAHPERLSVFAGRKAENNFVWIALIERYISKGAQWHCDTFINDILFVRLVDVSLFVRKVAFAIDLDIFDRTRSPVDVIASIAFEHRLGIAPSLRTTTHGAGNAGADFGVVIQHAGHDGRRGVVVGPRRRTRRSRRLRPSYPASGLHLPSNSSRTSLCADVRPHFHFWCYRMELMLRRKHVSRSGRLADKASIAIGQIVVSAPDYFFVRRHKDSRSYPDRSRPDPDGCGAIWRDRIVNRRLP